MPTGNRRRSRRRSGGKDEEGAGSPAPTGVTSSSGGCGSFSFLVGDAELCGQVMAAALALCGEVQVRWILLACVLCVPTPLDSQAYRH